MNENNYYSSAIIDHLEQERKKQAVVRYPYSDCIFYPGGGLDISPIRLFRPGAGRPHGITFRSFLIADLCIDHGAAEGELFMQKIEEQLGGTVVQRGETHHFELNDIFAPDIIVHKTAEVAFYAQGVGAANITPEYLTRHMGDALFAKFEGEGGEFLVGHLRCDAILALSLFADREGDLPRGLVIKYHGLAENEWPGWGKPINELLTNGPVLRVPPEIIWDGGDLDDYHYIDKVAHAYENLGDFVAHDAQYQDTRTLWQRIA